MVVRQFSKLSAGVRFPVPAQMQSRKDFSLLFWIHLTGIILVYLSPFLLPWNLILILIGLYYLQLLIFGNCLLTRAEFNTGRVRKTFYYYYLNKIGINLNEKKLIFVLDYVIPWLILALSLFWQVGLNHYPLLRMW